MSAKLRSLIDYLTAPWRFWRRGRRLPARLQVTVLLAGVLCLGSALAVWSVAWATPQEGGEPGMDGQATYEEVHRLRTVDKDYAAARALALQFLGAHAQRDRERQMVSFEYGMTLFDAQDWPAASSGFEALVAEYADTALDPTAEDFLVDDAAYYGAVTEHYHGDRPLGIARYESFLQSFPESNRRSKALLMLAGAHEQTGDLAGALPVFEQLVQEFPDSEYAPEAQIHVGQIVMGNKDYTAAATAFNGIAERWPDSRHVPTALQAAARALIHQELVDWEPHDGVVQPGTVDHSAALEALGARMVSDYGDSPLCVGVLDDLYNYYAKRAWWNAGAAWDLNTKLRQLAQEIQARDPEGEHGTRAVLRIADTMRDDDPAQAAQLIESALQAAVARGQNSVWFDARFAKARLLSNALDQQTTARAIFQEMLVQDLPRVAPEGEGRVCLRGEIEVQVGLTYIREGASAEALDLFERLAEDEELLASARATASYYRASVLNRLGQRREARAVLDAAAASYPETVAVTTGVQPLRAALNKLP